jgi:DnaK suppressor protein
MRPEQFAHFHKKLLDHLTGLLRMVDVDLRDSVVERAFRLERPEDEADSGERDLVDDLTLRLDERAGALAVAIERALDRMAVGQYGRCVDCDCEIPLARLEALPWAERCAEDQARIEREHREHAPTL